MTRSNYIGASETGAIVTGSDEYGRNPVSIYLNKLGLKEESESEIMQRGLDLEYTLYKKYLETQDYTAGWQYQPCTWEEPLTNPDYPWLACHPDAINYKLGKVLEIKLIGNEWPIEDVDPVEWLKNFHPSKYYQAQTLMLIPQMNILDLFVHIDGHEKWRPHMFNGGVPYLTIYPNKNDMLEIVEKTHDFFYTNIKGNKIPESVEEKPIELKTDWVETDPQLIQDIEDFAVMAKQEHDLKQSFDNLKDKLKAVYGQKPYKSILAGQILLRANMKSGASRLSKDRCIANGLDLTGCYERGKPVYTLEVARRKE